RRHEPDRPAAAPDVERAAVLGAYPVLPAAGGGPARPHRLGADALRLRQHARGRDGEDALRPLLHQASLRVDRPPHPARYRQGDAPRTRPDRRRGAAARAAAGRSPPAGRLRSRPAIGVTMISVLSDRIHTRTARIAVIGQGYVGLPLAVAFAQAGFQVRGLDADPERVAALTDGRSHSPDVAQADLTPLLRSGRY